MQLPFTNQEFFDLLQAYNTALWPAVVALWVVSALVVAQLGWLRRPHDRWISALLALHWAWSGIAYHLVFFTRINPAAWLFGALFLLQAALLLWSGVIRGNVLFRPSRTRWTMIGYVLMVYALLYPAINVVEHASVARIPTFGLPCPTTIFTAGLLVLASPAPRHLSIVPIIWSVIGGSAAFLFGVSADYALPMAGAALALFVWQQSHVTLPRRLLLAGGIVAPVMFVAMTLFVGVLWEGYSVTSQVPSELSAIDAPTRTVWMWLSAVYAALLIGFGWSLVTSFLFNRALRVTGALLMAQAVLGFFWPPMHQRAVLAAGGATLTDTLHLWWAAVTVVLFMLVMGFGAAALGKRFRAYTLATMALMLACGAWTGTYASRIQADLPTHGVGVWERISIAAFMLWVAVLATTLLRASHATRYAASTSVSAKPSSASIHWWTRRKPAA